MNWRTFPPTGQGVVTLNWTSGAGVSAVEIRKGAPNGPLVKSGGASGSLTTNKWVTNGTVFYLQNVTYGLPLTSANTLATVTAGVTTQGCPRVMKMWDIGAIFLPFDLTAFVPNESASPAPEERNVYSLVTHLIFPAPEERNV